MAANMASSFNDYYAIFKLAQNATQEAIKIAYKARALALHPDKNTDNPTATANFQLLNEANVIFSNPSLRRTYDYEWAKHYKRRVDYIPTTEDMDELAARKEKLRVKKEEKQQRQAENRTKDQYQNANYLMPETPLGPSGKKYDPFGRSKYMGAFVSDCDKAEDWDNEPMAPEETHDLSRCFAPTMRDTSNLDATSVNSADTAEARKQFKRQQKTEAEAAIARDNERVANGTFVDAAISYPQFQAIVNAVYEERAQARLANTEKLKLRMPTREPSSSIVLAKREVKGKKRSYGKGMMNMQCDVGTKEAVLNIVDAEEKDENEREREEGLEGECEKRSTQQLSRVTRRKQEEIERIDNRSRAGLLRDKQTWKDAVEEVEVEAESEDEVKNKPLFDGDVESDEEPRRAKRGLGKARTGKALRGTKGMKFGCARVW